MVLQVALIALGVFLGLAGEQWREDRENQRLAADTLHRFRAEVQSNRDMLLVNKDYHADRLAELNAYFAAPAETRSGVPVRFEGVRAPRFQRTAWELAIASGTMVNIDREVAFWLSRTYADQAMTDQIGANMMQVLYQRPPTETDAAFFRTIQLYYGDLVGIEPGLIAAYDNLILMLDEELAK